MAELILDLDSPEGRYERMLVIRCFEQKVDRLFVEGLLGGTAHLCIGHEACAVGAVSASLPGDPIVSNHRGHGHFLARCPDPTGLMAELLGKSAGTCGGRGGSQHLCAVGSAFYGTNGITGGGIPLATGLALSASRRQSGQVVFCFFGDGACTQGTFHESLNMAALWGLPVIFFCENNLYAMSTALEHHTAGGAIAAKAAAYAMESVVVDGMDVEAVRTAVSEARRKAAHGPTLIEAQCYRFCGHSKSDRLIYRSDEEESAWRQRDPITLCRARLSSDGVAEERLRQIEQNARACVEKAYEAASGAPDPLPGDILVSPYAERDAEQ